MSVKYKNILWDYLLCVLFFFPGFSEKQLEEDTVSHSFEIDSNIVSINCKVSDFHVPGDNVPQMLHTRIPRSCDETLVTSSICDFAYEIRGLFDLTIGKDGRDEGHAIDILSIFS